MCLVCTCVVVVFDVNFIRCGLLGGGGGGPR